MNLKEIAKSVPNDWHFVASKYSTDSNECWELVFAGPRGEKIQTAAYAFAEVHRGHGNRLRYILACGGNGEALTEVFHMAFDPDLNVFRIVRG